MWFWVSPQAAARQASGVSKKSLTTKRCDFLTKGEGEKEMSLGSSDGQGDRGQEDKELASTSGNGHHLGVSCIKHYERVLNMYNGLGASLFGTTVSQGVYFYFYSTLKSIAIRRRHLGKRSSHRREELGVAESLSIASLAGMANVLLTNPIWIVATRMQTYRDHLIVTDDTKPQGSKGIIQHSRTPSTLAVIASIYHDYGVAGFWNGVRASLIMVINPTIQYAIYEWLLAARSNKKKRPSSLQVFLTSAVAKAGATVITYPMLTVKTRMMSARKLDTDLQYSGVFDAVTQIMKREGPAGYYRGMSTKITQSILGAAILLVCKEKITDITRDLLQRTL